MLRIENISKTFNPGTVNAKQALNNFSLHVREEDFITIVGANGAGKSTLFNAVSGRFITDSGRIFLKNKDITLMPEHHRSRYIGRLFQDPMLGSAPGMTIEDNLALAAGHGGWLSRISRQDKELFRERLSLLRMGLEDRMHQPVGLLSGGQRQALTLMMATINKPDILLLDEPTSNLDSLNEGIILKSLKEASRDKTVVLVSHRKSTMNLADVVFEMENGRVS